MKTRILKKISKHIRIVEDGDNYLVQNRKLLGLRKGMSPWKTINTFSSKKKAIERKNMYIVMILMRDLGFQREFIKRRKGRRK